MKIYVTFGQSHVHSVNGKVFDKDCVAVIYCDSEAAGRELAFKYFGPTFCFTYYDEQWTEDKLKYFPRGYVEVK